MSLDIAELDYTCNVIRRQVEEEFRNLSVVFIVHKSGERKNSLFAKKNTILSKPSGRKTYDMLTLTKNVQGNGTEFVGLIVNQARLFHIFKRRHHTAVFFINADEFVVDQNAKHLLYHLVWHSIDCYKKSLNDIESTKKKYKKSFILRAEEDKFIKSMHNLMADVFGAVMMESQGHSGYIQMLNKKRATDTLNPSNHFEAESYPFPVACEACQFVYDDVKSTIDPKAKIINLIMDLASEVASTYGEESIEEWQAFGKPAQEMAWMGYNPEQILGTAIYTSEDTQVRAIAYMIAETIDCEPESNIKSIDYNPFVNDNINERNHNRVAEEKFQDLLAKLKAKPDIDLFKKEAKRQTNRLLRGIPTGWAAPALLRACYSYNSNKDNDFQSLKDSYYGCMESLPWDFVKKLSEIIIDIKKNGQEANEDTLIEKLDGQDAFKTVIETLKEVKNIEVPADDDVGKMSNFLYDSYQPAPNEKAGKKLSDFN